MADQKNSEYVESPEEWPFEGLESYAGFEITPCENAPNFSDTTHFTKLQLNSGQKIQISALAQHIPSALATTAMAKAYVVKFPKGLPHTLTVLNQGGFSSAIQGANSRFVGTASLYAMSPQAVAMGAFTAMSIASGQYFLSQINNAMDIMTKELDDIINFLETDKKSELISEINFIRYAYQNCGSIMVHDHQRTATILSLQDAKKTAMKDIEFYINDLRKLLRNKPGLLRDFEKAESKLEQSKEPLELSKQLFLMCSVMESYFSQNQDPEYLLNVENDIAACFTRCDKQLLESFTTLNTRISDYNPNLKENLLQADKSKLKIEELKKKVSAAISDLRERQESAIRHDIRSMLYPADSVTKYYLSDNGEVYIEC